MIGESRKILKGVHEEIANRGGYFTFYDSFYEYQSLSIEKKPKGYLY